MDESPTYWKLCSSCKKPIFFGQTYQVCSVSTCNHVRRGLQFCTVSCWSAHVPLLRHKDAWALEKQAPARAEEAPRLVRPVHAAHTTQPKLPQEVLVVVSKLKAYVKARADMNTSADVIDCLSDRLRNLCDEAIEQARADGRKTVMARDF